MARQLQELQKENARLKRLVAEQAFDNQIRFGTVCHTAVPMLRAGN